MSGRSLNLNVEPFPALASSLWPRVNPAPRWRSNRRSEFVFAPLAEAQRGLCISSSPKWPSCPKWESSTSAPPFWQSAPLSCCWPDQGVLTETLKSLNGTSSLRSTHIQSRMDQFFVDFSESQPPALLVYGKQGLHPELEWLQLQAFRHRTEGQIPV